MAKKLFESGDLVWAKIKGYSHWPARIADHPEGIQKKNKYYVSFFGTNDCSWVVYNAVVPHSEYQVERSRNKKIPHLKEAINEIVALSSKSPPSTEPPSTSESSSNDEFPKDFHVKKEKEDEIKTESVSSSDSSDMEAHFQTLTFSQMAPLLKARRRFTRPGRGGSNTSPPAKRKSNLSSTRKFQKTKKVSSPRTYKSDPSQAPIAVIKPYADLDPEPKLFSPKLNSHSENSSVIASVSSASNSPRDVEPTDKKIGFLGLGNMGHGIIRNFLDTGHKVTVWSRTHEKCLKYKEIGAVVAETPADLVKSCDIIFSYVEHQEIVKEIVFGKNGIIEGLEQSQIGQKAFVEMTTIEPVTSQNIYESLAEKHCRYLEAPISGTREKAEEGSLLILASGDCRLFNECETCFFAIASKAYFLGSEVGTASKMNLAANMLMGTTYAILGESMALLSSMKLSKKVFVDILNLDGMKETNLIEKGTTMLNQKFTTENTLKYQLNTIIMAWMLGDEAVQPTPVTSATIGLFQHANLLGYSEHDVSAVYWGAKY